MYVHETFLYVFFCFHKSAEDDEGAVDEIAGGSGDEETSKNVVDVNLTSFNYLK